MPNPDPLDLPPQQQDPSASGSVQDLHGLIRLVLDKSWLIVSCVVLAVIAAAVYVVWAPRIYQAVTTVQVEQEEAHVLDASKVVQEDLRGLEVMNTVAQKFTSAVLLEQALEANNLIPPENSVATNITETSSRDELVTRFSRSVTATLRRNTRLIDVSVRNTNPLLAAKLANSLVDSYLDEDAQVNRGTVKGANAYLKQQADELKIKLETAERALQDYRRTNGAISLEGNTDIITPQLQDLSKRLTQTNMAAIAADGDYEDSLKMTTNVDDLLAYSDIATDPDVVEVSTAVARMQNDFAVIKQRYREKHPKYVLAKSSLEGLQGQLAATVLKVRSRIQESKRIAYQNDLTAKRGLEAQLHDAETNSLQLSDSAVQFNVLNRERDADKALFESILNRLNETAVGQNLAPDRIRVIQTALVPDVPASPKVKLIFALALFGGLAVGLGISFVLYSIDTSFRTVDEVEHHLGLPVLGSVPKLQKAAEGEANKLVAAEGSNSPGAEVFRTLRTTLSMLGREKDRRTYLFTSSLPGEGKTFTSVNYAVSLAQQGLRVLLIDLDLRRPMIEEFFNGKKNQLPGVTDYFLGRKKISELCIQHKDVPQLSWIPAGTIVPNPAELLIQADFQQLLNEGLASFDRVVIDTAPLLPVSDTLLLAGKVQTVVLVVHGCKTSRKAVERSVQMLNNSSAPLGGVVLNLLPNRRYSGYYYSYYHGYGYGHYGRKETDEDKDKLNEFAS